MVGVYYFFLIFDLLIYVLFIINNINQIYFREKYFEIVKIYEFVYVILEIKILYVFVCDILQINIGIFEIYCSENLRVCVF